MSISDLFSYPNTACNIPNSVIFAGQFQIDDGNAPDVVKGRGFTVARTAAGKYTVTADGKIRAKYIIPLGQPGIRDVDDTADADAGARFGPIDENPSGGGGFTAVIYVDTAGTDGDIDNAIVSFALLLNGADNLDIV